MGEWIWIFGELRPTSNHLEEEKGQS